MNERQLKDQICEIGRRVYAKGFAAANDGNISIRLNRARGHLHADHGFQGLPETRGHLQGGLRG